MSVLLLFLVLYFQRGSLRLTSCDTVAMQTGFILLFCLDREKNAFRNVLNVLEFLQEQKKRALEQKYIYLCQ